MNPRCDEHLFPPLNIILNSEKIPCVVNMGLLCSSNSRRALEDRKSDVEGKNDDTVFDERIVVVEYTTFEHKKTLPLSRLAWKTTKYILVILTVKKAGL